MTLLAKGFRPFFLLAAVFGAAIVPLWLLALAGWFIPAGPLVGVHWHAHEMIHGFTVAVLAGFLLTAVGNWTGRETATGKRLGGLALGWLAGRVALLVVPGWAATVVDLAFLPALAAVIAGPIWRAKNYRNAAFPVLLLVLWAANLAAHLDAHGVLPGAAATANRAAVHVVVVIILVVTGRIVPMFTRNATGAAEIRSLPALDRVAIGATGALAVAQLVPGAGVVEAALAGVAAVAVAGRAWGWGARHTLRDPLLWVLHAGHGWVAVGLALHALAARDLVPRALALHALTAGSIGMLTLGMMARVALGHTGRPIRARPVMGVAFAALLVA
ncbi:MAG: NnrS family protein, partial [Myxococcota bacterium]